MGHLTIDRAAAIALLLAGACAEPPAQPAPRVEPPVTASAPVGPPAPASAPAPRWSVPGDLPGPAPRARATDPEKQNRECEGCHADIAVEWRASLHRRAHTDPLYQRALAIEPLPFCRGCHAPEADPSRPPPEGLGALGVGCVTCHVVGGRVLAGKERRGTARAPHDVSRDPRFASAGACGGCHEFPFPDQAIRPGSSVEWMQSTLREHAVSAHGDTPCAGCHMPLTTGPRGRHRRHDFDVSGNPAVLRAALDVRAEPSAPGTVRLRLTPRRVGHAVPTGDLFRRLEVRAEAIGPDYAVVAEQHRYLTRHFRQHVHATGTMLRSVERDDRPGAAPGDVVVEMDLGEAARASAIAWRITYQRVEHPRSESEDDSLVGAEVVVAEGRSPPRSP